MTSSKQYNEAPSTIPNLGIDIPYAHRHRNNTFETPEELRQKAVKKANTSALKALLALTKQELAASPSPQELLKAYELKKAILSCELWPSSLTTMDELKTFVLATTDYETRNILRKKYNGLLNARYKIAHCVKITHRVKLRL